MHSGEGDKIQSGMGNPVTAIVQIVKRCSGGESALAARGRQAHKNYENTLGGGYDFNKALPSGKRPDAIDFENRIVRELKPDNPRAVRRGEGSLKGIGLNLRTLQVESGCLTSTLTVHDRKRPIQKSFQRGPEGGQVYS